MKQTVYFQVNTSYNMGGLDILLPGKCISEVQGPILNLKGHNTLKLWILMMAELTYLCRTAQLTRQWETKHARAIHRARQIYRHWRVLYDLCVNTRHNGEKRDSPSIGCNIVWMFKKNRTNDTGVNVRRQHFC